MTDDMGSGQQPAPPAAAPAQPPGKQGGTAKVIVVIVVVIIVVLASILLLLGGDENEDDKENGDGGGNGNGDKDVIKYITALGGKSQADAAANAWDESAVLQHVRGFSGPVYKIDRDEWNWVSDYDIPTEKDENIGDGRCMVWEYEYFPETGDPFDRLHVLVFGNGTVIQWEDQLSDSANTDTLSDWELDSNSAVDMAKTLSLYNNITNKDSAQKYIYYELWPYYWELIFDDGTDYIRIQIDESAKEIIYHYP